ncbi:hypothetical protein V1639_02250 [Pseudarthrobacter sp. J75]|uniref:hypothetical protein n=1 Tax=unclassified Pseudarthrobacter TaxID=2647000 RepID=UPI002E804740|nr:MULTISPECIES: hypothetical protein [unclassified Pseudarthrobacter]MEE2521772.1 hypothetical protein [Pseudarthrobacter sp. J47]MEE2527849.1 hypothetical protein [Pseudarthrobacter sp. J75]
MSSPQEPNQPGSIQPGSVEAGLTPPPPPSNPPASYTPPPYGQNAPPAPFGLPGQPPRTKSRKGLYIVLGIVAAGVVLVVAGIIVLVSLAGSATSQAKGVAEDFTDLVIAGESDKAYDYLDPALQEQLSQEDFVAGVASLNMDDTCKPEYRNVTAATENGRKSADVAGLITCADTTVELEYRFEGTEDLKMINIKLKPPE